MLNRFVSRLPLLAYGGVTFVCGYAASIGTNAAPGAWIGAGVLAAAGAVVLDRSRDGVRVAMAPNVISHAEFLDRLNARIGALSSAKGDGVAGIVLMDVVVSPLGRVSGVHDLLDSRDALVLVREQLHRNLPEGAFATCVGEEEFMVCLPDVRDMPTRQALEGFALARAAELMLHLRDPVCLPSRGAFLPVVARAGVDVHFRGEAAVDGAQRMIQASIASGCGSTLVKRHMSVTMFSPAMAQARSRAHEIESRLQNVVRSNAFRVFYQPVVDIGLQRIAKVEALLRWPLGASGRYSPAEFIPIAERAGHISAIWRFVLAEALRQHSAWQVSDFQRPHVDVKTLIVSVNVTVSSVLEGGFFEHVMKALDDARVSPFCLELELIESEGLIADGEGDGVLRRLQDAGVRVAIDDFGTGFSSLSYLPKINPDTVKIDRSFIRGVLASSRERKLLGAICALCREMEVEIVAEGVETMEQVELLEEFGVTKMQGFVFARPRPAEEALQIDLGGWHAKLKI